MHVYIGLLVSGTGSDFHNCHVIFYPLLDLVNMPHHI